MATATIIEALCQMDESPWSDIRGKPIDSRRLARMLNPYGVTSTTVRIGNHTPKGYRKEDLHDAWQRYLGESPKESATSATPATPDASGIDFDEIDRMFGGGQ